MGRLSFRIPRDERSDPEKEVKRILTSTNKGLTRGDRRDIKQKNLFLQEGAFSSFQSSCRKVSGLEVEEEVLFSSVGEQGPHPESEEALGDSNLCNRISKE